MSDISCTNCKLIKPRVEMKKVQKSNPTLGKCKVCYRREQLKHTMRSIRRKNPQNYAECSDCGEIFSWVKQGNPRGDQDQRLRHRCPHCDSRNLEDYIGGRTWEQEQVRYSRPSTFNYQLKGNL